MTKEYFNVIRLRCMYAITLFYKQIEAPRATCIERPHVLTNMGCNVDFNTTQDV